MTPIVMMRDLFDSRTAEDKYVARRISDIVRRKKGANRSVRPSVRL